MSFGAPFCRGVEPFLANLRAQLDAAAGMGLDGDPIAVAAQAVYDDINGFVLYIPYGNDCERHTKEVQSAISRMKSLVGEIALPRPDAEPPPEGAGDFGLPSWVKVVLIGGLVVYGLATLRTFMPPQRRLAGRNRRRR